MILAALQALKTFVESEHPRDADGKFTDGTDIEIEFDQDSEPPEEGEDPKYYDEAMNAWSGNRAGQIATYLRTGKRPFGESPTEIEIEVKQIDKFLNESLKEKGTFYRGLQFNNEKDFNDFTKQIEQGGIFTDKSFMATSRDKKIVEGGFVKGFNKIAEITVKGTGVSVEDYSRWAKEQEILFKRNSKFKITGFSKGTAQDEKNNLYDYIRINMEQL